jgi:hypothetical protein
MALEKIATIFNNLVGLAAIIGSWWALTLYSIVVSCQRHGHDPLAYLRDVLTRLPALTNRFDLDALTPVNWKPA